MAQGVCVVFDAGDRARLAAIASDQNRLQKHVQRARIILLSAERLPVAGVARQAAASRPAVWRWQARYAHMPASPAAARFCISLRWHESSA